MRNAREATAKNGGHALAEVSRPQGLAYSLARRLTQAEVNDANPSSAVSDSNIDDANDNSVSSNDASSNNANSDVIDIYLAQARAYQAERQWQKAINACQAALEVSLNSAEVYRLLGNLHQQQGKVPEALGFYAKALSLRPHSAEVYSNLGGLYAKQKDWAKAIAYFDKALLKDPQFAPAYFNLSKVWKQRNNPEEAQSCLLTALKLAPDMGTAQDHYQMAQSLEKEKKAEDAITFYQQFVARAPEESPNIQSAYQRLTELLEEKGDWKSATECYHKVMELTTPAAAPTANLPAKTKPHKVSALSNLSGLSKRDQHLMYRLLQASAQKKMLLSGKSAKALLQPTANSSTQLAFQAPSQPVSQQQPTHQQWAQAVRQLKQAVKQSPRSAPLYRKLAKAFSYNQQTEQSAEAWFRAFLLEPDWPSSQQYFELGKRLEAYEKKQAAAHCYKQVLRTQPEANAVREKLLQLQQQIGKEKFNQDQLNQKQLNPSQVSAGKISAQKLGVQKKSAQAPETQHRLKSTQILKPEQVQALANAMHQKGENLRKAGKWQAAKNAYKKAIQLNPSFSWSHHSLGDCCKKLGDVAAAAEAYRKAISLNSQFIWSYYSLAEVLEQEEKWEAAAKYYRRARIIAPDNEQVPPKFASVLKKLLETAPRNIGLYETLANQLLAQNKIDEAIAYYQMALQIQPQNTDLALSLSKLLSDRDPREAHLLLDRALSETVDNQSTTDPAHVQATEILQYSHLFDPVYYLNAHPQVANEVQSQEPLALLLHYFTRGSAEGYNPNPLFNERFYQTQAVDTKQSVTSALVHYYKTGYKVDANPHPFFNSSLYKQKHKDVASAEINPLEHYLTYGAKEGREAFFPHQLNGLLKASVPAQAAYTQLLWHKQPEQFSEQKLQTKQAIGVYCSSLGNYFIAEIADFIAATLAQAGHEVIRLSEKDVPPNTLNAHWVVAPHEFFYLGEGVHWEQKQDWLSGCVMVNVEQPQTTWFSKAFHFLRHCKVIFDINVKSAEVMHEMGLPAYWLPLGYLKDYAPFAVKQALPKMRALASLPERISQQLPDVESPLCDRPIDIHFIGTLNSRRETFFAQSASWLSQYRNFLHIPPMGVPLLKGEDQALDTEAVIGISRRSKILLNIHRDELPYFEWHRIVFHGLWQNTLVVTEPCHDVPGLVAGKHFIACELEDIAEKLNWLLRDPEGQRTAERIRKAGYEQLKSKFDGVRVLSTAAQMAEQATKNTIYKVMGGLA